MRHGAVKQVQVGAADAAKGDPNLHLSRLRLHGHALAHAESTVAFEEYRLHD